METTIANPSFEKTESKNKNKVYQDFMGNLSMSQAELEDYFKSLQPLSNSSEQTATIKEVLTGYAEYSSQQSTRPKFSSKELDSIYTLAYQTYTLKHYKQAIGILRMLFTLNPLNLSYSYYLGLALEKSGKFFEASTAFLLNSELDETNPNPLFKAALCFIQMGEKSSADQMFKKALKRCGNGKEQLVLKEVILEYITAYDRNKT
jgi:tetratricopeptide (TPR) repeat protein